MKTTGLISSIVAAVLLVPIAALAAPHEHLDWGAQLNAGPQSCPSGTLIINVTQKILNDDDSGVAGNAWAKDDIVRHIKVVQLDDPAQFCATVSYEGSFTTIAGPSPQNTGAVGDGVVGTFEGGYTTTTFSAELKTTPAWRTRGSVGTFDYQCDGNFNCPGYVDWSLVYFNNLSGFNLNWWGWTYHAGNNGSWNNVVTGNTGDITGD